MSREFGWTPEQIGNLTLQELDHYFAQSIRHHNTIPPVDVTLDAIRRALFGFFGVKEQQEAEAAMDRMATASVTAAEKDAWLAAGMPSPMGDWLGRYRSEHHG